MTDVITDNLDIWSSAILKKRTTGRGSSNKIELYGIKKLRELILDLAVNGSFSENSNSGWDKCKFGDILSLDYGKNLPKAKRSNTGEYPVFGSNGIVGTHNECVIIDPCIVVGRKGSAGALNLCDRAGCWVTDVAYSIVPPESINLEFCFVLLQTLRLDELGKGIKPGLSRKEAYQLDFILPPLEEQKRIVAKVDELMSLCDQLEQEQQQSIEAHQTLVKTLLDALTNVDSMEEFSEAWEQISDNFDVLFTTEESVEYLKQTILQLAVMGKLVEHDSNVRNGKQLLDEIRKRRITQKGHKKLIQISTDEIFFELPNNWTWCRLGDVMEKITDGTHHSPPNTENGDFLYLTAKNVKNDGVLLDDITYVNEQVHDEIYQRCNPEYGDILYIKDGATTGVTTINTLSEPFSMLSSVALLKPPKEIINKFLLICLKSPYFYNGMRSGMSGVAITRVTLKKLNNALVPLPPIEEQERIISMVEMLMDICEEMFVTIKVLNNLETQLADSIKI